MTLPGAVEGLAALADHRSTHAPDVVKLGSPAEADAK